MFGLLKERNIDRGDSLRSISKIYIIICKHWNIKLQLAKSSSPPTHHHHNHDHQHNDYHHYHHHHHTKHLLLHTAGHLHGLPNGDLVAKRGDTHHSLTTNQHLKSSELSESQRY